MSKLIINSYEEFASHLGQHLGVSEWLKVDQKRINDFADATLDHNGFMLMKNVQKKKAHIRVLLHMAI